MYIETNRYGRYLDDIRNKMSASAQQIKGKMDHLDSIADSIIQAGEEITKAVCNRDEKRFLDLYTDLNLFRNEWLEYKAQLKDLISADISSTITKEYNDAIVHSECRSTIDKLNLAKDVFAVAKARYDLLKATGQFPPQDDSITI